MYEVKSKEVQIEGQNVELYKREVISANILEVTAGTNGYQGGDSGHGSRTYFRIRNLAGSDLNAQVLTDKNGNCEGVQIVLGGDTELETFIRCLKFATKVLEDQSKEVYD